MEIKVFETNDYSIFKKLDGNRDIYSVNSIIDSINRIGYVPSPVCVNEKMEVIDGQNRIEALKSLGLPVHYYVVNGVGIKEARQMNIGRRNWSVIDYIKSYANEGRADYQAFLDLCERHSNYSTQELWGICSLRIFSRCGVSSNVKYGELGLTIEQIKKAEELFPDLDAMRPALYKLVGQRRMAVATFAWVLSLPKVDKKRVVKVVNEKYPSFIPVASVDATLKDFSKYYNSKLAPANRIFFDVEYRMSLNNKVKE